jgi:hypothetical protein
VEYRVGTKEADKIVYLLASGSLLANWSITLAACALGDFHLVVCDVRLFTAKGVVVHHGHLVR